ncbi:MBL fold metallo-hydrolase [Sinosporangium siamense]|uniref:MBL fold metallo-hydrolase n=1 Tax=Sinosporangium siamense TaxID=1367973 RepID=A0A919RHK5_9ACTN|nr:MBL fold metallo-hydrolase [Sinosporangium siamense]GII92534.1 MBL fold metallo-hydrolase [Sinosporangium siamense]
MDSAPARPAGVTPANEQQRTAWRAGGFPEVERVRPGIWSIPVPLPLEAMRYVLVYALEVPGGVVLVDAGWDTDEAYTALCDGLATAGYAITDVKGVLVTHIHHDHYGLAGRVRESSGAWVGLHPADAALLDGDLDDDRLNAAIAQERSSLVRVGAPPEALEGLAGMAKMFREYMSLPRPDRLIEDGERLDLRGWNLQALWTPGHSPGHLCFVEPDRRLLFSGDHVLPKITPIVAVHARSTANPLADYLDSLAKVRDMEVEEVLPAHEYRFLELADRVDYVMAHHHERLAEIEAGLGERDGVSCWELAGVLTWSRPWEAIRGFMRRAACNETLAHLVWLEARGRVVRVPGEPDLWYVKR